MRDIKLKQGGTIMPSRGDKTGIWVKCENCGKLIYKTLYQFNKHKHHYCSNKCQSELKHRDTYEDRACEICGKILHIRKKSKQRFCSDECQNIWQTKQVGLLNKRCKSQYISCDYCGKEFLAKQYKINDGRSHFCSKECRKKWYTEVWSQSDEWKEESRIRAANILKDNTTITQTKPQLIINELLNNDNIKFTNEESFIYYSVDNYLSDYNLIIEVMGDYWHSNPVKFNLLNEMQKKNIIRDKSKHSFLYSKYNIEILYLWEEDILNNPLLCKNLINLYINKKGLLENYHSFNYELIDEQLVLKTDLIIPYQDMDIEIINRHIKPQSNALTI